MYNDKKKSKPKAFLIGSLCDIVSKDNPCPKQQKDNAPPIRKTRHERWLERRAYGHIPIEEDYILQCVLYRTPPEKEKLCE